MTSGWVVQMEREKLTGWAVRKHDKEGQGCRIYVPSECSVVSKCHWEDGEQGVRPRGAGRWGRGLQGQRRAGGLGSQETAGRVEAHGSKVRQQGDARCRRQTPVGRPTG